MIFMQSRASKKEAKRRAEMFSSMKKHDKVQTIGGVIGTIVDVQENEIVLRVEEGRIRFAKSAIQQVIKEGKAESVAEGKPDSKVAANV